MDTTATVPTACLDQRPPHNVLDSPGHSGLGFLWLSPGAHCYPCRTYVLSCGPGNVPASLDQGLKQREQPSQGKKSEAFT